MVPFPVPDFYPPVVAQVDMKPCSRHLPSLNEAKIQSSSFQEDFYSQTVYYVIFQTRGVKYSSFELYDQLKSLPHYNRQ